MIVHYESESMAISHGPNLLGLYCTNAIGQREFETIMLPVNIIDPYRGLLIRPGMPNLEKWLL